MNLEPNAVIDPLCCVCEAHIGTMTLDIYMLAVQKRGAYFLCQECRTHKCDSCGWFFPDQIMKQFTNESGKFIGNGCGYCDEYILSEPLEEQNFAHFLSLQQPSLIMVNSRLERTQQIQRVERVKR